MWDNIHLLTDFMAMLSVTTAIFTARLEGLLVSNFDMRQPFIFVCHFPPSESAYHKPPCLETKGLHTDTTQKSAYIGSVSELQ